MKILGIDYGTRRIGLAICGALKIASPVCVIARKNIDVDMEQIKETIEKHDVEKIVIGLPKNMDNTNGEMVNQVTAFGEKLSQHISLPIDFWDERLSTWEAQKSLISLGLSKSKRTKMVDAVAAALILQSYVDKK